MGIKLLGIVLTLAASTGLGFWYGHRMTARLSLLRESRKYFLMLKNNIGFAGVPLPEAFSELSERSEGVWQAFFAELGTELASDEGLSFESIWTQVLKKHFRGRGLSEGDLKSLLQLGGNFGYLDKGMQIQFIDLYLAGLDREITELADQLKEKTRLCRLLGIMGGLFIVILFI
ncbi:stage III sporulation protein AB [Anaerolentibacter hominis]|uniref:stage III sporulation protein AB n=1 Tax=Anaerolentibacter hominis TaxID=3079009 RepID=UPI0031B828F2